MKFNDTSYKPETCINVKSKAGKSCITLTDITAFYILIYR